MLDAMQVIILKKKKGNKGSEMGQTKKTNLFLLKYKKTVCFALQRTHKRINRNQILDTSLNPKMFF